MVVWKARVGCEKKKKLLSEYGLGEWNDREECLVELCKQQYLVVNTVLNNHEQ